MPPRRPPRHSTSTRPAHRDGPPWPVATSTGRAACPDRVGAVLTVSAIPGTLSATATPGTAPLARGEVPRRSGTAAATEVWQVLLRFWEGTWARSTCGGRRPGGRRRGEAGRAQRRGPRHRRRVRPPPFSPRPPIGLADHLPASGRAMVPLKASASPSRPSRRCSLRSTRNRRHLKSAAPQASLGPRTPHLDQARRRRPRDIGAWCATVRRTPAARR